MRDEYRFVGPTLFVLSSLPEEAKFVRNAHTKEPVEPLEVWINLLRTWVRLNGEWVSGRDSNGDLFAFRPNWLNRWKLRRAGTRWFRANGERTWHDGQG